MNFQPFIGLLQSLKHTVGLLIGEEDQNNLQIDIELGK